jgi:hypothetical protein
MNTHSDDQKKGHDLLAAAEEGRVDVVESLLRRGVDPNTQNGLGRTALHQAVSRSHAEVAACLLAYGAKHQIVDHEGRPALSADCLPAEAVHAIRQRYQRFRTQEFVDTIHPAGESERWAEEFSRRGIIHIPAFVEAKALSEMRSGFEKFIRELDEKRERGEGVKQRYDEELHWWAEDRAYVSNNAFKYSAELH